MPVKTPSESKLNKVAKESPIPTIGPENIQIEPTEREINSARTLAKEEALVTEEDKKPEE